MALLLMAMTNGPTAVDTDNTGLLIKNGIDLFNLLNHRKLSYL